MDVIIEFVNEFRGFAVYLSLGFIYFVWSELKALRKERADQHKVHADAEAKNWESIWKEISKIREEIRRVREDHIILKTKYAEKHKEGIKNGRNG